MNRKVNVKKLISEKGQWVHYDALKGTSDFFFHIQSWKPGANLHLILGAVSHWVPSSDRWRCRTTAKKTGSHFSSFLIPISPPKGIKLYKNRAWSLSTGHDSCSNSISNTKQEIKPLEVLLEINQHFCPSQRFNLPFWGAEEFHPGKGLQHKWSQSNTKFIPVLTQAKKEKYSNSAESTRVRAASSYRAMETHR